MFCSFTLVPCCKQDAVFGICFVLYRLPSFHCNLSWYCGVTTMKLIHSHCSPITAIKLCNCFKVTNRLMVKSLSPFLPLNWEELWEQLSTELGRTPVSVTIVVRTFGPKRSVIWVPHIYWSETHKTIKNKRDVNEVLTGIDTKTRSHKTQCGHGCLNMIPNHRQW